MNLISLRKNVNQLCNMPAKEKSHLFPQREAHRVNIDQLLLGIKTFGNKMITLISQSLRLQ